MWFALLSYGAFVILMNTMGGGNVSNNSILNFIRKLDLLILMHRPICLCRLLSVKVIPQSSPKNLMALKLSLALRLMMVLLRCHQERSLLVLLTNERENPLKVKVPRHMQEIHLIAVIQMKIFFKITTLLTNLLSILRVS